MKKFATVRVSEVATKYGEHAPIATTACCNACRTCVTANVLTLAATAATGLGAALAGRLRRMSRAT